jgi:hypothetical protein
MGGRCPVLGLAWVWLRADDNRVPDLPNELAGLERVIDIPGVGRVDPS